MFKSLISVTLLVPIGIGLMFLMNVLIARMLGPEGIGLFQLTLSLANILSVLATLGLYQSVLRFIPEYRISGDMDLYNGFISWSKKLVLLSSIIIMLVLILFSLVFEGDKAGSILYSAILVPIISFSLWRKGLSRALNRLLIAIVPKDVVLPFILVVIIILIEPGEILHIIVLYTVISLAVELVSYFWLKRDMFVIDRLAGGSIKYAYDSILWLKSSLSNMTGTFFRLGMQKWDIIVIGLYAGLADAGKYAVAVQIALILSVVLRITNLVYTPSISEHYHNGRMDGVIKTLMRAVLFSSAMSSPIMLAVYVYPEHLLSIYGQEYIEVVDILKILTFGYFINAITGPIGVTMIIIGSEKSYAYIGTVLSIAGLVLMLYLVPSNGLVFAAVITSMIIVLHNVLVLAAVLSKLWYLKSE